jgi:hypothetical protein
MTSTLHVSAPSPGNTIEIQDAGRVLAQAEVSATDDAGVVHSALSVSGGHLPAGTRACLVDAVLDSPRVLAAERLLATLPVSDTEMLERMRERCAVLETRAAGATKLVEARLQGPRVPSPRRPG